MLPIKTLSDQYELDINVFFNVYFHFRFLWELFVLRSNGETHRNKDSSSQRKDGIFNIFDTVVNRTLPYLHENSHENMLLVPLKGLFFND